MTYYNHRAGLSIQHAFGGGNIIDQRGQRVLHGIHRITGARQADEDVRTRFTGNGFLRKKRSLLARLHQAIAFPF
jgi:hypothetical protein